MKTAAYFTGFSSKADGSGSLRFNTNELTAEDFAGFKRELNEFGHLVFAPQGETVEVPTEKITDERKKPSQRLRAVLFLLWKKRGEDGDFDLFYRNQIEKIVDKIKPMLDD